MSMLKSEDLSIRRFQRVAVLRNNLVLHKDVSKCALRLIGTSAERCVQRRLACSVGDLIRNNYEHAGKTQDGEGVTCDVKPFDAAIRLGHPNFMGFYLLAREGAYDGSMSLRNFSTLAVVELVIGRHSVMGRFSAASNMLSAD
jgi:hypothetical protein